MPYVDSSAVIRRHEQHEHRRLLADVAVGGAEGDDHERELAHLPEVDGDDPRAAQIDPQRGQQRDEDDEAARHDEHGRAHGEEHELE